MAFLDRSSLIVDAVLTKLGRQRLSENQFNIVKFALGDDEIDYSLYNEANSQGPNNYGVIIDNMPIHEAFVHQGEVLKYKLVTRASNANKSPDIGTSIPNEITITGEADYALLSPSTINDFGNENEDYIFELSNDKDVTIILGDIAEIETVKKDKPQVNPFDDSQAGFFDK
jgi:hypothetical protein